MTACDVGQSFTFDKSSPTQF